MQSGIVKTICQVGVFIVCAQMLVHFRPERSYVKYLKMLVSSMIVFQVIVSLKGLIAGGAGTDIRRQAEEFERQLEESMRAASQSREQAEELREKMSLEEVGRRLKEQAQEPEEEGAGEMISVEKVRIDIGRGGEADGGAAAAGVEEMVPQG